MGAPAPRFKPVRRCLDAAAERRRGRKYSPSRTVARRTQGLLDNSIRLELEFRLPDQDPVPLPGARILQGLLDAEPFQKARELHHRVLLVEVDAPDGALQVLVLHAEAPVVETADFDGLQPSAPPASARETVPSGRG